MRSPANPHPVELNAAQNAGPHAGPRAQLVPARLVPGRLLKRPDYLRVARARRKVATPGLVLQALVRPGDKDIENRGPRLGFTASRKVGNAVARNRARRRLKAAAREVFADRVPEPVDYVLIARAGTLTRRYDDLLGDLSNALQRILRGRDGEREKSR